MARGKKLDQSGNIWNTFVKLKKIRDDVTIHPKLSGFSISYSNLANNINLFKKGIARLLVDLHLLFGDDIPSMDEEKETQHHLIARQTGLIVRSVFAFQGNIYDRSLLFPSVTITFFFK